jgi:hypothetical protein
VESKENGESREDDRRHDFVGSLRSFLFYEAVQ